MHSPFFIKLILFFNFCDIMLYYNNSHGQNEVNQVKKKTLVPLITFLLGICLVGLIVYKTDTHEKNQRHILDKCLDITDRDHVFDRQKSAGQCHAGVA